MSLSDVINQDVTDVFLNEDDFAEKVTFLRADGSTFVETCLVGTPEVTVTDDEPTEVERLVHCDEDLIAKYGVFRLLRIQGESWHVIHTDPAVDGMRTMRVRRHNQHDVHSNVFDMHDEQAGWS